MSLDPTVCGYCRMKLGPDDRIALGRIRLSQGIIVAGWHIGEKGSGESCVDLDMFIAEPFVIESMNDPIRIGLSVETLFERGTLRIQDHQFDSDGAARKGNKRWRR